MASRATGRVVEHEGADGLTYRALRFTAFGRRRYLSLGPVSQAEAERELRHVLADVERGIWQPPQPTAVPEPMPSFHEYAEEWWTVHEGRLARETRANYRWRLEAHLLPFFAEIPLDRITFKVVESYIASKLAEDEPLSATSINMTLTLLSAIAAGQLDREAREDRRHVERRAMLSVLAFAALRIGELCRLRWHEIELDAGWLHVAESKTHAGVRRVKIRPPLAQQLHAVRERRQDATPEAYVFATRRGRAPSDDTFRSRVFAGSVRRANETQDAAGRARLPEGLSPHSLRRTFASVLYALGEDPGIVMDEMGHTDPGFGAAHLPAVDAQGR